MAPGAGRDDLLAEFCDGLSRLRSDSGVPVRHLARYVPLSTSRLYDVLAGRVRDVPDWQVVEPIVRICGHADPALTEQWRVRHGVVVAWLDHRPRPAAGPVDERPAPPAPWQLPAAVSAFTGRARELDDLDRWLARTTRDTNIVLLSGTGGVGKTALALHWAHAHHRYFPDGEMYVDLRGHSANEPLSPSTVLARFLRALGVAGADVPLDADERAVMFRSVTTGRRLLVFLDNAADPAQVRPLLPGSSTCTVLITSRNTMGGLVARDGARRIEIDRLSPEDGRRLLRSLVGSRVDADPDAAETLIGLCAHLPLAVRVLAELAVAQPSRTLADVVRELSDGHRLRRLDAHADEGTAIGSVLSWSYRSLPESTARVFRLIGRTSALHLPVDAIGALAALSRDRTSVALHALSSAHLLETTGDERYGMHDLLRLLAQDLDEPETEAGLARLLDYYIRQVRAAVTSLFPAESTRFEAPGGPGDDVRPTFADGHTARLWLDRERPAMQALITTASTPALQRRAITLAAALFRYLHSGRLYPDALIIYRSTLDAAEAIGDRPGAVTALVNLAVSHARQGRHEVATTHLDTALALSDAGVDDVARARLHGNYGTLCWQLGRYADSIPFHENAYEIFLRMGDESGQIRALDSLGTSHCHLGHYALSQDYHLQARSRAMATGDDMLIALTCVNHGIILARTGRWDAAETEYTRSVHAAVRAGEPTLDVDATVGLGEIAVARGRYPVATDLFTAALRTARDEGHRIGEGRALDGLGQTMLSAGRAEQALGCHLDALGIFERLGDAGGRTAALVGAGLAFLALGRENDARDRIVAARRLAAETGDVADQARVEQALERLRSETHS